MSRPRIKISRQPVDWGIELAGLAILLVIVALVISQYGGLPDRIPSHYDASGTPDNYGDKSSLLLLLGVTIATSAGLFILNLFPHIFNYPVTITEANAEFQYKRASRLIRMLNTIIIASFSYIIYSTLQTAIGSQSGLGTFFMPVFLIATFAPIIWYMLDIFVFNKSKNS